jgi:hypothetical protein
VGARIVAQWPEVVDSSVALAESSRANRAASTQKTSLASVSGWSLGNHNNKFADGKRLALDAW